MRGLPLHLFDKVIELAETGEEIESIARTVGRSGATVKTLIAINKAVKRGRPLEAIYEIIPSEETTEED